MDFHLDRQRNVLLYPRQGNFIAAQVQQAIPEAREINGAYLAVPHTLRNSQVLRLFNFPVPGVMDSYDWPRHPSIVQPYESQKLAANFMVLHPRAFNLSDMGVGKTITALWAADFLMRAYKFKALIVCPLSIMQRVWGDAIFRHFLNRRTFEILHGTAEQRLRGLEKDVDFFIVNFDGVGVGAHTRRKFELDGFSKQLAKRDDIRLCIVDEASALKDASTKRHRIAREVYGKKDYLWLLSGTPVPNAPTDAYGLAKIVNNAQGKSFRTFQMETMYQPFPGGFKWLPQRDGYEKARRLLMPSIRIDIKQVWDGPEMTTQQREVPLTAEQKQHMAALKKDLQVALKSGALINAANEAAARQKFMQISLGAIYDAKHEAHLIDSKLRIEELRAVLTEAPGKVLIFAGLTSVLDLLYKELAQWSREIVNGSVGQKERSSIFSNFQNAADPRILIADPATMAHGLDLYAARTVVWYGPVDKTELYLQANKRAHRPGQRFPVTIAQLVSNPLEREIYRRLETNTSMQGVLLAAVQRGDL